MSFNAIRENKLQENFRIYSIQLLQKLKQIKRSQAMR